MRSFKSPLRLLNYFCMYFSVLCMYLWCTEDVRCLEIILRVSVCLCVEHQPTFVQRCRRIIVAGADCLKCTTYRGICTMTRRRQESFCALVRRHQPTFVARCRGCVVGADCIKCSVPGCRWQGSVDRDTPYIIHS